MISGRNPGVKAKPKITQRKRSTSSDEPSAQSSQSDSDNKEPSLTKSNSSSHTSKPGSENKKPSRSPDPKAPGAGTDKLDYFWLETTTEDTDPDEPTKDGLVTQLRQGQERQHRNDFPPGTVGATEAIPPSGTIGATHGGHGDLRRVE